ncbi:MAG TPA: hypothetical protein VG096_05220 [Bryobacteraceae bacterium]|jgi:hypothetical protein|nr:hypothetical protein [Bryobacteraceae bacterium]
MEVSRRQPDSLPFPVPLAGLEAGMIAALWMLAWMGSNSAWQRRSFWTAENLLASTFFGGASVRDGFSAETLSGLALYLLVYSILGCVFAAIFRLKLPPVRLLLASILAALGWYYVSFHGIWKALSPLIPLLHAERPTILGHVIYGAVLARYPRYLPRFSSEPVANPETPDQIENQPL